MCELVKFRVGSATASYSLNSQFFAWGHGLYGQLGLGECQLVDVMAPIDSAALSLLLQHTTDAAVELRCGPFSTYVFVKGTSTIVHWGLLPSSDPVDKFVSQGVPVEFPMIDQDVEIADIAVGLEHIVVLSFTGHALSWGFGRHGQLGLSHEVIQNVDENAQRVDFFNRDITITSIACGWHHTLALTSDKSVFAWGSNRLGACGATTRFHKYFHPVRVTLPSAHDDDLDYTISCCGDTSMLMARSSNGALAASYVWGVCSNTLLSLAPVEILDVRHQHPNTTPTTG
uniref:Uncharacterized protein n=1 Tax=Globisporangium ultimum (strain ATCC 200006 / CBS 805.95 / DAOM BR144) TaxID=431595 RepID=K3XBK2_GLOUD